LAAAEEATKFFMGKAEVHRALTRVADELDRLDIPYALIGALALSKWGFERVTVDVDLLLTAEGLATLKAAVLGRGYVEKLPGSRSLRDLQTGVGIDVVLAGGYPGDGQPKPVAFPDPARVSVRRDEIAVLPLPSLLELKLASGMSAPHRLKDLADVLEVIRELDLPRDLGQQLDASVRDKYDELWQAAQVRDPE